MLVLSRQCGQTVLVGNHIKVTVVRISPNAVRLGIEAPQEMNIVREEIDDGRSRIQVSDTPHSIQVSNADIDDLGRRPSDD